MLLGKAALRNTTTMLTSLVFMLSLFVLTAPASAGAFSLFAAWTDTDDAGDAFGGGLAFAIPLGTTRPGPARLVLRGAERRSSRSALR